MLYKAAIKTVWLVFALLIIITLSSIFLGLEDIEDIALPITIIIWGFKSIIEYLANDTITLTVHSVKPDASNIERAIHFSLSIVLFIIGVWFLVKNNVKINI